MKKPGIFVIQPFTKASDAVFQIIASASTRAGASILGVSPRPGESPMQLIEAAVRHSDLIIADVSDADANVMYEVGFAQAQQKPVILVAESSPAIPFHLAHVQVFIYDLKSPAETIERLTRTITSAIKSPDSFVPSSALAKAEREKRQSVFISYSHHDREYLDRLLIHLKPLEKEGLIDLWVDTRLRPGDRWKKEIEKALQRANVAVLLVSADFLASDFVTDNELPPLLRNAEDKGTRIIPLIVKPCRFARDKNLRQFNAINDPKDSLVRLSEGEQELLYDSVASEVEKAMQRG